MTAVTTEELSKRGMEVAYVVAVQERGTMKGDDRPFRGGGHNRLYRKMVSPLQDRNFHHARFIRPNRPQLPWCTKDGEKRISGPCWLKA